MRTVREAWAAAIDTVRGVRLASPLVGRVAINRRPLRSSWGGGNQWAGQLTKWLHNQSYAIRYDLDAPVDCIIIAAMQVSKLVTFDADAVRAYKARHPHVRCLHRINESDQHRGSTNRDALLAEANSVADHTVFISEWVRDYHAQRWFDLARPHTVIPNGADPEIFHPHGSEQWRQEQPLRLVTHHWSDNWRKGFVVYQELDKLIAEGRLPATELWIIGRWPKTIRWQAAKTFGPMRGHRLASLLRRCHAYITASCWEAGGMHCVEGAQCGLPLLYHVNGGGIVELGRQYGIAFDADPVPAIQNMRQRYLELRQVVLRAAPSGAQMCQAYGHVIKEMLTARDPIPANMS